MLPLTMMVMSLVHGVLNQNAGPVVAREEQLVEDRGGRLRQGGGHLVKDRKMVRMKRKSMMLVTMMIMAMSSLLRICFGTVTLC